jgi:hypothetical protein
MDMIIKNATIKAKNAMKLFISPISITIIIILISVEIYSFHELHGLLKNSYFPMWTL